MGGVEILDPVVADTRWIDSLLPLHGRNENQSRPSGNVLQFVANYLSNYRPKIFDIAASIAY